MITAPCKGCDLRRVGCHSDCELYKAFAEERDYLRKKRRVDDVVHDYTRESIVRSNRKRTKLVKRLNNEQKG